ncbi:4611_t:CDS:1, partial [Gigaspora margarita]
TWKNLSTNKKNGVEEADKSYQHIKPLLDNLLNANPRSVTAFEIDSQNQLIMHFYTYIHGLKLLNIADLLLLSMLTIRNQVIRVYLGANAIKGKGKLVLLAFAIA